MQESGSSSFNNGRGSHVIGRLGNLIQVLWYLLCFFSHAVKRYIMLICIIHGNLFSLVSGKSITSLVPHFLHSG